MWQEVPRVTPPTLATSVPAQALDSPAQWPVCLGSFLPVGPGRDLGLRQGQDRVGGGRSLWCQVPECRAGQARTGLATEGGRATSLLPCEWRKWLGPGSRFRENAGGLPFLLPGQPAPEQEGGQKWRSTYRVTSWLARLSSQLHCGDWQSTNTHGREDAVTAQASSQPPG